MSEDITNKIAGPKPENCKPFFVDLVLKRGVQYKMHFAPDGSGITKITEMVKGKRRPLQVYP